MFAQRLYKLVGKSTPPLKPLAQHIYELDRLSARFPEQLYKLLWDDEWVEGIQRLPKSKLVELIGYLDNVRPISTPTKSYSSSPQILDGLDHKGPSFEEGLHVLREICSSRAILPPTYNLGGKLSLNTIRQIISLRSTETYKGTLGNADVRIKRLNIKGKDERDIRQVFHPHNLWLALHALTSLGGTLLEDCGVEAPQSPEHCVLQGCHLQTLPDRVRMDTQRNFTSIRQEKYSCRFNQSCEFTPSYLQASPHPVLSCSMSPKVLITFTRAT